MDSVKLLAQKCGMTVPEQEADAAQTRMRKRILSVNRAAANFYYRMLTGSDKRGLQYFVSRHLTTTTIKKYGLGFAPDTWDALTSYLLQNGFTEEELVLADVAHRSKRGTLYDTFRNRVIFPIVDLRGNVIGFGGRVLDDSQPKYLNTAQTPVFDKGKNLFSLQFAKNAVTNTLILAEGYMDVIAVNQAGFENVVATLGTAITPDQARKISQYAKTVVIAYDSDAAGQNATQKAMRHFSEVGIQTKVLRMKGAKDPDEYIQKFGAERFRMLLEGADDAHGSTISSRHSCLNSCPIQFSRLEKRASGDSASLSQRQFCSISIFMFCTLHLLSNKIRYIANDPFLIYINQFSTDFTSNLSCFFIPHNMHILCNAISTFPCGFNLYGIQHPQFMHIPQLIFQNHWEISLLLHFLQYTTPAEKIPFCSLRIL